MRRRVLCCCVLLLAGCPEGRIGEDGVLVAVDGTAVTEPQEPATGEPVTGWTRRPAPAAGTNAAPSAAPPVAAGHPPGTAMGTGGPNQPGRIPAQPFRIAEFARFDQPWAMTFLPDGRLLVTEKPGRLRLFDPGTRRIATIAGVPRVAYGGQGGLGDVVLHPQFASNRLVYLSFAEPGADDTRGAAVVSARLVLDATGGGFLSDMRLVWRQWPKVTGYNHYSHRLAFGRDGRLWISSGERFKFEPAQDLQSNLGKILRLEADGSVPPDNPFVARGGRAAQVWTLGHRNVLGLAFDLNGRLWSHEMGPSGGDELNLVQRGTNYGWPVVSEGDHYDGTPIPRHRTRPEFNAPEVAWNPVIAPAGFVIYTGWRFPYFHGHGFIGGLRSRALVRIQFDGTRAREAARYPMERRIREVEQGPEGALWLLEDGPDARLLRLTEVRL